MANREANRSPTKVVRTAAVLYLLTVLLGMFSQNFVGDRLIVESDAAATATNILAHRELFHLGFAIYMVEMACNISVTILLYELFKPVNRTISLLAASFSLVGCVIKIMSRLFYLMPLFVLDGAHSLSAFSAGQVQSLALLLLKVNAQGAAVAMVFFGLHALLKGYLIMRSTFLPDSLGVIGMLAGLGWLTFLYSPIAYRLLPYTLALGLLGSASQVFWLLVFGVNEERWKEQVHRA